MAVVADGMGGMNFGKEASELAIESFHTLYSDLARQNPSSDISERLQICLEKANQDVVDFARQKGMLEDIGTTLVAAVIKGNLLYWVSVGDSRAYLYREEEFVRITTDHNYANELRRGGMPRAEALADKDAEALTGYLGMPGLADIDMNRRPMMLEPGDQVLLCSDGLYGTLNDNLIAEILQKSSAQDVAHKLMKAVLGRNVPHQDNVTITVLTYDQKKRKKGGGMTTTVERKSVQRRASEQGMVRAAQAPKKGAGSGVGRMALLALVICGFTGVSGL